MQTRALLLVLVLAAAMIAGVSSARGNHGYVMPFDTFQPKGWGKYADSNRLLAAKCRPRFDGMGEFAGKNLRDVLPGWRHVKLDRLRAKRERIRDRSSTCSPVDLGRTLAAQYGWTKANGQWPHLFALFNRESGWNPCRHYPSTTNCSYSGPSACGIPQFVPCSKLLDGCGPTLGTCSVATQIRKGYNYVRDRYGDPATADYFQLAHNYY